MKLLAFFAVIMVAVGVMSYADAHPWNVELDEDHVTDRNCYPVQYSGTGESLISCWAVLMYNSTDAAINATKDIKHEEPPKNNATLSLTEILLSGESGSHSQDEQVPSKYEKPVTIRSQEEANQTEHAEILDDLAKCQKQYGYGPFAAFQPEGEIEGYKGNNTEILFAQRDNLKNYPTILKAKSALEVCKGISKYIDLRYIGPEEINKYLADMAGVDYLGRNPTLPDLDVTTTMHADKAAPDRPDTALDKFKSATGYDLEAISGGCVEDGTDRCVNRGGPIHESLDVTEMCNRQLAHTRGGDAMCPALAQKNYIEDAKLNPVVRAIAASHLEMGVRCDQAWNSVGANPAASPTYWDRILTDGKTCTPFIDELRDMTFELTEEFKHHDATTCPDCGYEDEPDG